MPITTGRQKGRSDGLWPVVKTRQTSPTSGAANPENRPLSIYIPSLNEKGAAMGPFFEFSTVFKRCEPCNQQVLESYTFFKAPAMLLSANSMSFLDVAVFMRILPAPP